MAYNNEKIGNLDNICSSCNFSKIGTLMDILNTGLKSTPKVKYSGSLLTQEEVAKLNNMCPVSNKVSLGTIVNGLLSASKNSTTVEVISNDYANIINNMCGGAFNCKLGDLIQELAGIINDMAPSTENDILTYNIEGQVGETSFDRPGHELSVVMPTESDVTELVSTFTLSAGATAKIGNVSQISGETKNDFTQGSQTYEITAEDGVSIQPWIVTVTKL